MSLARYYHTLKYLRPIQLYGRVRLRFLKPRPRLGPAPERRAIRGTWVPPCTRAASLVGPTSARFLNQERGIDSPSAWNDPSASKLWLYNLHYFDDLNAQAAKKRGRWHEALLVRWVTENPPGQGTGWEPYPTSLRIVNWIKWVFAGNAPGGDMVHRLAVQSRYLHKRVELHLLGNHLVANAKALIFAGLFFRGVEADAWCQRGLSILTQELDEQVLPDGGHFERSPMYHSLVLEDLLDLINLVRTYYDSIPVKWQHWLDKWAAYADRMRVWLKTMTHSDGNIALFNDAAFKIAPPPAALEDYALRLKLDPVDGPSRNVAHLRESGYVRLQLGPAVAFLDVAPIGPDYLPAHAHADTLSFELSVFDERVIVHSGTSCYESGIERQQERGTAAHNTVRIDGRDSSEVWGAFRVARRAYPCNVSTEHIERGIRVSACHNGYTYLPGRPHHCREWLLDKQSLQITDSIEGSGTHGIELFYHLHPDVAVERLSAKKMRFLLENKRIMELELNGEVELEIANSTYHPEFGMSIANKKLVASGVFELPARIRTLFSWEAAGHP